MMINFNQVSKRYHGGFEALNDVSLHLEKGEMAFLTGPSGSGKTTLLKLIAGLEAPTSGELVVNGVSLHKIKRRHIPSFRSNLGIVFQSPFLLNDRTVFDNVALPLQIQGATRQMIAKRVPAALEMVGLLSKEKMRPLQLSTGEQQCLGIARAVVYRPALLVADEPTGNLDPSLAQEVMKLFTQFHQVGVSVLIAKHDLGMIASMPHRILTLKAGHLC